MKLSNSIMAVTSQELALAIDLMKSSRHDFIAQIYGYYDVKFFCSLGAIFTVGPINTNLIERVLNPVTHEFSYIGLTDSEYAYDCINIHGMTPELMVERHKKLRTNMKSNTRFGGKPNLATYSFNVASITGQVQTFMFYDIEDASHVHAELIERWSSFNDNER